MYDVRLACFDFSKANNKAGCIRRNTETLCCVGDVLVCCYDTILCRRRAGVQIRHSIVSETCWCAVTTRYCVGDMLVCSYDTILCLRRAGVLLRHDILSETCWCAVTTQYCVGDVLVCSYETIFCRRRAGVQLRHNILSETCWCAVTTQYCQSRFLYIFKSFLFYDLLYPYFFVYTVPDNK